tara:strand:+ start:2579 stop:4867 length:2289 start_codon:yes stop_codon:yes gene_type:complete
MKHYLPITLLMLTMASGLSAADYPPAQVATAKTAKPQIAIKATVLEIDWKQLAESKDGLSRTIRAFTTDPRPHDASKPQTQEPSFHTVAVPQTSTDGIVRLLMDSKAIKVLGRPQLTTLAGQPVDITIDSKIPIMAHIEILNGKQHGETKFHHIGTNLEVTPQLLSDGGLTLAVAVEHSQQVGRTGEQITEGFSGLTIQTRKLDFMVALTEGQSIILCETGPPGVKEKNQLMSKGLAVILSPSIISATQIAPRLPGKGGDAANVVRLDSTYQLASPWQQTVQPATFVPQPKPQDLHQSVRELRSDVRSLQRDVGRLLSILEKKKASWNDLRQSKASPSEQKILKALKNGVSLKTENLPLADVMRTLSQNVGINIVLDPRGLVEEGLDSQTPISIEAEGIMLKSVLNLMLLPLQLAYQVQDEVLVITSQTRAQGKMTVVTYPVADLAIPIPLAGPVPDDEKAPSANSPAIDFDSLIEIIQSSVHPRSWDVVGGTASIRPHESTLSLVIRQSLLAHQEIENLLAQLRRLQDTQVTVESRFLDKLPEEILKKFGIDFDSNKDVAKKNAKGKHRGNGPLGGIILTDQQAKLLLQAAQYNDRINLIQGPKITLFNGQTAGVMDLTVGGKQHPLNQSLHLQPVISADRRNVRLNLRVSELESPGAETRAYVNMVPDGKTLLIEIVQRDANEAGVPMSEKVSNASKVFKSTGDHRTKSRRFLLIRPRIIVAEEEEKPILPPASKLQLMLTPRGGIPEEEEALLGIKQPE